MTSTELQKMADDCWDEAVARSRRGESRSASAHFDLADKLYSDAAKARLKEGRGI